MIITWLPWVGMECSSNHHQTRGLVQQEQRRWSCAYVVIARFLLRQATNQPTNPDNIFHFTCSFSSTAHENVAPKHPVRVSHYTAWEWMDGRIKIVGIKGERLNRGNVVWVENLVRCLCVCHSFLFLPDHPLLAHTQTSCFVFLIHSSINCL